MLGNSDGVIQINLQIFKASSRHEKKQLATQESYTISFWGGGEAYR
jgi:hypothetical protein